jgi:hypothetical protein
MSGQYKQRLRMLGESCQCLDMYEKLPMFGYVRKNILNILPILKILKIFRDFSETIVETMYKYDVCEKPRVVYEKHRVMYEKHRVMYEKNIVTLFENCYLFNKIV